MKQLFTLLFLIVFVFKSYSQNTNQFSEFSVPTHKCEFSNNSSDEELYKGHNYEYYNTQFKKAQKLKSPGVFFCILGGGSIVWGAIKRANFPYYLGGIMLNAGIPLWIAGSVKAKNNKNAMEQFKQHEISLKLGSTQHGIGLSLNF